jgi:hypothetical protein
VDCVWHSARITYREKVYCFLANGGGCSRATGGVNVDSTLQLSNQDGKTPWQKCRVQIT